MRKVSSAGGVPPRDTRRASIALEGKESELPEIRQAR